MIDVVETEETRVHAVFQQCAKEEGCRLGRKTVWQCQDTHSSGAQVSVSSNVSDTRTRRTVSCLCNQRKGLEHICSAVVVCRGQHIHCEPHSTLRHVPHVSGIVLTSLKHFPHPQQGTQRMDVNKACPVIMVVNVMVGEVSMRRAAQLVRLANTACRYQRLKLPCFTIRRVLTIGTE